MKYFKNKTGEVFGYDETQQDLIDFAIKNKWEDVTGKWPPALSAPTPQEQFLAIQASIQARLDTFAQTRGYDSILSATTYATSTVERFAKDGQYCVEARDLTWAVAIQIQEDVDSGKRPLPTYEQVEAELPKLAWPV